MGYERGLVSDDAASGEVEYVVPYIVPYIDRIDIPASETAAAAPLVMALINGKAILRMFCHGTIRRKALK